MKVSVTMRQVIIQDAASGETCTVPTLRSVWEIADLVYATERDEVARQLERLARAGNSRPDKATDPR